MILLVLDAQEGITNERLFGFEKYKINVNKLIAVARDNEVEVIYVRHDDGPSMIVPYEENSKEALQVLENADDSALISGKPGFEIFHEIAPRGNEKVYDKTVNSAFRDTGLLEYLSDMKAIS